MLIRFLAVACGVRLLAKAAGLRGGRLRPADPCGIDFACGKPAAAGRGGNACR